MAKKKPSAVEMARAQAAARNAPQNAGPGLNKAVVLILLAALVPFSLPTVVLVFFTALPTLGAWLSEKGQHKYAWLCVGGLNFAGLIPYLFGLWFGVHTLDEAFRLLTDATMLLVVYGCSGLGWLIYIAMPPMVASYLSLIGQRRVANLKSAQKKLIDDWGDDVAKK